MKSTKSAPRRVRKFIKARLNYVLAILDGHEVRPFRLRVRDESWEVAILAGRPGSLACKTSGGGLFLSPLEMLCVKEVGPTGCLIGKQIAGGIGQRYTPRLRTLLNNLVHREILSLGEGGQGYRWSDRYRSSHRISKNGSH